MISTHKGRVKDDDDDDDETTNAASVMVAAVSGGNGQRTAEGDCCIKGSRNSNGKLGIN